MGKNKKKIKLHGIYTKLKRISKTRKSKEAKKAYR